jgi:hypothetical protein
MSVIVCELLGDVRIFRNTEGSQDFAKLNIDGIKKFVTGGRGSKMTIFSVTKCANHPLSKQM